MRGRSVIALRTKRDGAKVIYVDVKLVAWPERTAATAPAVTRSDGPLQPEEELDGQSCPNSSASAPCSLAIRVQRERAAGGVSRRAPQRDTGPCAAAPLAIWRLRPAVPVAEGSPPAHPPERRRPRPHPLQQRAWAFLIPLNVSTLTYADWPRAEPVP